MVVPQNPEILEGSIDFNDTVDEVRKILDIEADSQSYEVRSTRGRDIGVGVGPEQIEVWVVGDGSWMGTTIEGRWTLRVGSESQVDMFHQPITMTGDIQDSLEARVVHINPESLISAFRLVKEISKSYNSYMNSYFLEGSSVNREDERAYQKAKLYFMLLDFKRMYEVL